MILIVTFSQDVRQNIYSIVLASYVDRSVITQFEYDIDYEPLHDEPARRVNSDATLIARVSDAAFEEVSRTTYIVYEYKVCGSRRPYASDCRLCLRRSNLLGLLCSSVRRMCVNSAEPQNMNITRSPSKHISVVGTVNYYFEIINHSL